MSVSRNITNAGAQQQGPASAANRSLPATNGNTYHQSVNPELTAERVSPAEAPQLSQLIRLWREGLFLGLAVGNAVGALLMFELEGDVEGDLDTLEAMVEDAMQMAGGGPEMMGPGQTTHASELAIRLLRALVMSHPRDGFPADAVAGQYIRWVNESDGDVGRTLTNAFHNGTSASSLRSNSQQFCMLSESSGSLSRVGMLAVWAHRWVSSGDIMDMARQDAMLSHPNVVCQDANAVLCIALVSLLSADGASMPTNGMPAFIAARASAAIRCVQAVIGGMHRKIQRWFRKSQIMSLEIVDATHRRGHLKWPFLLAFHFLGCVTSFEEAVEKTCRMMGDAGNNCAIVGAMMGALHGREGIPAHMSGPVLDFDCTSPQLIDSEIGFNRPMINRIGDVMVLVESLSA